MESKNTGTNELIYKTVIESQTYKTKLMVTNREEGGGINWETAIDIYTLLKQMSNKNLLFITGNSTQYCVMIYMGTKSKKESIYIYFIDIYN